jgi:hypothetical protein
LTKIEAKRKSRKRVFIGASQNTWFSVNIFKKIQRQIRKIYR